VAEKIEPKVRMNRPLHISFLGNTYVHGFYHGRIEDCFQRYPQVRHEVCFDFYSFLFIISGRGEVRIGNRSYETGDHLLFLIPPSFPFSAGFKEPAEGHFIFFCKDFYAADFNPIPLSYLFSFFSVYLKEKNIPYLKITPEIADVPVVMQLIEEEYQKKEKAGAPVIRSYVHVIVQRLLNFLTSHYPQHESFYLINELASLVEKYYVEERQVNFYAKQLGMNERKLNQFCLRVFGQNMKQLILERVMMQARRMLEQTDLTVAEIAYKLNFSDNSNFNKIFKKYTHITPLQYRHKHKPFLP